MNNDWYGLRPGETMRAKENNKGKHDKLINISYTVEPPLPTGRTVLISTAVIANECHKINERSSETTQPMNKITPSGSASGPPAAQSSIAYWTNIATRHILLRRCMRNGSRVTISCIPSGRLLSARHIPRCTGGNLCYRLCKKC
jgi:hypothetical protein